MIHDKLTVRFQFNVRRRKFLSRKRLPSAPASALERVEAKIGFTVMSESGRFQVNITLNEMKNGKGRAARTPQANQDSNRRQLIFYRLLYF